MIINEVRDCALVLGKSWTQLVTKVLLPPRRRWALIYPLCVLTVSLVGAVLGASGYDKRNIANIVFTRYGWLITVAPLIALNMQRPHSDDRIMAFIRIALASLYWVFVTQFSFGSGSLIDNLDATYGSCSLELQGASVDRKVACAKQGGEWKKFDASGHCFLAVHGSLLIIEELKHYNDILRTWASTKAAAPRWIYASAVSVITAWAWMLVITSLYFHTPLEKLLGVILGQLYWLIMGLL